MRQAAGILLGHNWTGCTETSRHGVVITFSPTICDSHNCGTGSLQDNGGWDSGKCTERFCTSVMAGKSTGAAYVRLPSESAKAAEAMQKLRFNSRRWGITFAIFRLHRK